jgi:lysozyme
MPSRKNNINRAYFRFSLLLLAGIALLLGWFVRQQLRVVNRSLHMGDDRESTFSRYPGFAIWLPNQYAIHGIDVSRYQKRINWRLVRQMKDRDLQLRFAFIKATEGMDMVDPEFDRNWRKARETGMVVGAYHFFREQSGGHEQALHFLRQVKLRGGDLPPVLDVETYTGNNLEAFLQEVEVWLRVIENHYKTKPILYTNAAFYNRYLADRFDRYPLWVAHYQNRHQPRVARSWQFWQHNEAGRVNGIRSFVDFNVFNGSEDDFQALLLP